MTKLKSDTTVLNNTLIDQLGQYTHYNETNAVERLLGPVQKKKLYKGVNSYQDKHLKEVKKYKNSSALSLDDIEEEDPAFLGKRLFSTCLK
jgi:hypothetical protein